MSSGKQIIAKYKHQGDEFEIFVEPRAAYDYITGKIQDPMKAVEVEEVFKDANKGERQTQDKIAKAFGTTDFSKIAGIIMKNGDVPLTTEQKNELLQNKRKQIIEIISRNSIDPRTNTPHPPQRIENAMEQARVHVDPFKNATEQVEAVVKSINVIIPIKFATVKIEVTIPSESANRCYSLLKQFGLKSETWLSNGSLSAQVEFPAGMQASFFDKLNALTKGAAATKILSV